MNVLKSIWFCLGDLLLRLILLVGMVIVFAAGVYMSWQHTIDMGIRIGLPPPHAIAYTLFVETLLVSSEIVVLFRATSRRKVHKSVFVGVAFGATINMISNVSSFWGTSIFPENIGGVLLGATIPLGTAIAIWIFATTLTHSDRQTATQRTDNLDKRNSDKSDRQTMRQTDRIDRRMIDKLKTMGIVGQTITSDKTTDRQDIDNGQTTATRQTAVEKQTTDTTTDDKTADNDKTTGRQIRQIDIDTGQTDAKTTTRQSDSNKTTTSKQTTDTTTRQLDNQTVDTTTTDTKTAKHKLSLIKGGSKTDNSDDKDKIARQKAIDYYNQTGKFPSYRQLGEMAGVSKDKAGKIIRQLKQKIS